jgi:hypothetical protein
MQRSLANMVTVVIELKINSLAKTNDRKSCFSFQYKAIPEGPKYTERVACGIRLLSRISTRLIERGYEISSPSQGTFGATGMQCRVGRKELSISAWPPVTDESKIWQIRTFFWPDKTADSSESELDAWDQICNAIATTLESSEDVSDLRSISWEEAEREFQ